MAPRQPTPADPKRARRLEWLAFGLVPAVSAVSALMAASRTAAAPGATAGASGTQQASVVMAGQIRQIRTELDFNRQLQRQPGIAADRLSALQQQESVLAARLSDLEARERARAARP